MLKKLSFGKVIEKVFEVFIMHSFFKVDIKKIFFLLY